MTVVSDASVLINLARIDELDLLRRLYGELLVPKAVWQEVVIPLSSLLREIHLHSLAQSYCLLVAWPYVFPLVPSFVLLDVIC